MRINMNVLRLILIIFIAEIAGIYIAVSIVEQRIEKRIEEHSSFLDLFNWVF